MQVIRSDGQDGYETPAIDMIPLIFQWKLKVCRVKDCDRISTTIIAGSEFGIHGICEQCYQKYSKSDEPFPLKSTQ